MEPTLKVFYKEKVAEQLKSKLGVQNIHDIPRLEKVVVNCCVGKQADRKQAVDDALNDVQAITGQKAVITKSKKAVSNFKLREGEPLGVKVTLRGRIMWEFLERLIKMALPVVRDFRGVSPKAFDGKGNYTLGVTDQSIFPEVEIDKIKRTLGFDICIVTTATSDDAGRELLRALGMPFRDHKPAAAPTGAAA
ncbi:MAG: ribosomal protein [Verrucomicrobiales bacterium]|nr:ribosomal protein [Verrucomicrobiales bacterium]RYD36381.1 MAG: 50S ribosomal protein L5 [Verrucomicrobiaceae bacterium]